MLRLLLLFPLTISAADFYVSPSGLNTNPGTLAAPWKTIQKAANTLAPGDTAFVRGGSYAEAVTVGVSGSAAGGFVTMRNFSGEVPIIDGATLTPPSNANTGLFFLNGKRYVRIEGFEIRNYKATVSSTSSLKVPCGIHVRGASDHIEIRKNKIHDIWNHFTNGNGFGIAIYGNSATPMQRIVIDGNEVSACRTGNSETIAINGNVTDFEVTNNLVHDNTNIGIDAIGYEGTCPDAAQDRARGGTIRGNTVWNCTSTSNPAYANLPGAGGIYVDGGTDIVIERNVSYQNDIGIELASEHLGKATDFIKVRDNVIWRNKIGGIFMGGSGSGKGHAENNAVTNNTLWENDTNADGNGEIQFQYWCLNNVVKQNLVVSGGQGLLFSNPVPALSGGLPTNSGNVIDWNVWWVPGGASSWQWKNVSKTGFSAWKTASGGDADSLFADPKLANPRLAGTAPPAAPDLHLRLDSPAINAGDPTFTAASGELDIDGSPRVTGSAVDIGADELAPRDAWRVEKFGASVLTATALLSADPDDDGMINAMEYALGTDPLTGSRSGLPLADTMTDGAGKHLSITFTRPVSASDVTYTVQASSTLSQWDDGSHYGPAGDLTANSVTSEVSRATANGVMTITVVDNVVIGAAPRFLRLWLAVP